MKYLAVFIGLISVFITLPVSIFASYLMYTHVHATSLMWFLWWFQVPLSVLVATLGAIANNLAKKDK